MNSVIKVFLYNIVDYSCIHSSLWRKGICGVVRSHHQVRFQQEKSIIYRCLVTCRCVQLSKPFLIFPTVAEITTNSGFAPKSRRIQTAHPPKKRSRKLKIHSNLENISGPPSNLRRLPVRISNRSAIWLSLFLQHSKTRVADRAHYFTILEHWTRFLKVLRNTPNDNREGGEVEIFANRIPLEGVLIGVFNWRLWMGYYQSFCG